MKNGLSLLPLCCNCCEGEEPIDCDKEVHHLPEFPSGANIEIPWLAQPIEFGSAPDTLGILAGSEDEEDALDTLNDILVGNV